MNVATVLCRATLNDMKYTNAHEYSWVIQNGEHAYFISFSEALHCRNKVLVLAE